VIGAGILTRVDFPWIHGHRSSNRHPQDRVGQPATGEVLRELDCVTDADVGEAVARARLAQPGWAALGVRKRVAILREFQRLLHEKKSEVAA